MSLCRESRISRILDEIMRLIGLRGHISHSCWVTWRDRVDPGNGPGGSSVEIREANSVQSEREFSWREIFNNH